MAVKVEQGEETVMNMTPMIDITFNLVIFFMLTLDLSSKEYEALTLPFAYNGVEDKDDTADPVASRKLIVNVLPDGKIVLRGNVWEMDSKDPNVSEEQRKGKQYDALKALRTEMLNVTQDDPALGLKLREDDMHSKIALQIHGDRAAAWRYTQWIIATAASRQVKMYKVYFSVKNPAPEEPGAAPAPAGG
jgi:biopolymer transport protein ExbD